MVRRDDVVAFCWTLSAEFLLVQGTGKRQMDGITNLPDYRQYSPFAMYARLNQPTIYPVLAAWGFTTEERNIPSEQEIAQSMELVGYKNVELIGNTATPPIGMQVDLGAVGKGYASDEVAEILRENEINSALLDVGGSVQMIGKNQTAVTGKLV